MLLKPHDVALFFKLQKTLILFLNQRLKVIPQNITTLTEASALSLEDRSKFQEALANVHLIESFVAENPAHLPADELDIVHSWRHLVTGKFYIFRELKKYTVFLSVTNDPAIAYGVVALSQPFADMIGRQLPVLVKTTLLPFKGVIVYDGLMSPYRLSFGPGIRRSMNASFKEAKLRQGIITSLPMSATPLPPKAPKSKPLPKQLTNQEKNQTLEVIVGLLDQFCKEHLNEEYAALCRKMAEKLARKRPSPLLQGSPNAWASGIVRAVGGANFLHDKSQTPYMRSTDIDYYLGTSASSGAARLATIRKLLKIYQLDPNWTLSSRQDDNPMMWMVQVNGFMMDIRHTPREVQESAFNKGLIPYIPADRKKE